MRKTRTATVQNFNVFINCPYDAEYKKIFDAIVFAIHDCGFQARFAAQQVGGKVRLERITDVITECALSIHDLSRVELTGTKEKLPRFNMPFEAGMAYARRQWHHDHDLLLIDKKPYRYQKSLSDAAGLDIRIYKNSPTSVISCVTRFLDGRSPSVPGDDYIASRFRAFKRNLLRAATAKHVTTKELEQWSYASKLQQIMAEWIRDNK